MSTDSEFATEHHSPPLKDPVDSILGPYLQRPLRLIIEERYWKPIEEITSLETLITDPSFRARTAGHLGLYSDHGVAHVRDVAIRVVQLVDRIIGTLIPARSPKRLAFIAGCAVMLVYLHDVGMGAPINRNVHAQFAAQLAYAATDPSRNTRLHA
jgi:hypothetical protein